MNKRSTFVYFLISFVLLVNTASAQDKEPWKWFTPNGESFEVIVPYGMKSAQKSVQTDIGTTHPVTWICEGHKDDPNLLFMLSYVDYPKDVIHPDSIELMRTLLYESMQEHVQNLDGKLTYDSTLDEGRHPGIIYRATYGDSTLSVKCRMLIVGKRFYSLQAYSHVCTSMNYEMDRFLMSFRIKEK